MPEVLNRLCDTCNEAATRSLAILATLRRQQTIREFLFQVYLPRSVPILFSSFWMIIKTDTPIKPVMASSI